MKGLSIVGDVLIFGPCQKVGELLIHRPAGIETDDPEKASERTNQHTMFSYAACIR